MTQPETHQVVHAQLSSESFNIPSVRNDDGLLDEEEELNETPVVPTDVDLSSQMVRVTRPTPPNDFVLQRSLTTEKELLDLAFRFVNWRDLCL